MPGTQQKALLECCECGCQGCCVPTNEDGTLAEIPFEISAPNCPAIHGATGVFAPIDAIVPKGPCGACPTYCAIASIIIPGKAASGFGSPSNPAVCLFTTCATTDLCIMLTCERGGSGAVGLDECCGRLRLWVGNATQLEGDTGENPPNQGGCDGFSDCTSWRKFAPNTCSCEGTLSAEFDISNLQFYCDPADVWTSGPCIGERKCCQVGCDLTDATLVI